MIKCAIRSQFSSAAKGGYCVFKSCPKLHSEHLKKKIIKE